jgi:hypothetical protein
VPQHRVERRALLGEIGAQGGDLVLVASGGVPVLVTYVEIGGSTSAPA